MAEQAVVAPVPPGVQAPPTIVPAVPKEPLKVKAGDKYKAEFEKLTKNVASVPPKEEPAAPEPKSDAIQTPTEPSKKPADAAPTPEVKPESPLDAVLAKETPKEPEKPAEEPDVLKEFDEKTANWTRAREVMKTQSASIKELNAKLAEREKAPKADPSVIETLTKERDQFKQAYDAQEEKLKAINYQYSDEYQGLIKARDATLTKISSRVKAYGGDANALIAALALPDGKVKTAQIKEALADVESEDKPRIHALIETLDEHNEKIGDAYTNAAPKWEELQAKREAQLQEESVAAVKQLETEYGKLADELPAVSVTFRQVPDDVPGATDWNKEIRDAIEGGLSVLKPNGADFRESALIAAKGRRFDSLEKRYLSLHAEHIDLKKQYKELVGSGPDFRGQSKPSTEPAKKPGLKYREAFATLQGAGAGEV